MASKIEWTDETWNPVTGCTPVSEGCANCYAKRMAKRLHGRCGYPETPHQFDVTLHPDRLDQPLRWKKPRTIFVCSMGDLFHEEVPFDFIDKVFAVAALCPQHTFQVLTKRPERMKEYLSDFDFRIDQITGHILDLSGAVWGDARSEQPGLQRWYQLADPLPLPNVWLGVTAENQATADERIPLLLQCPAAVRFVSVEPLLSMIDIRPWLEILHRDEIDVPIPYPDNDDPWIHPLDWVIVGGETGPGARPMDLNWARSVRDQCVAAGVPFFLKSLGEWSLEKPFPACGYDIIDGKTWWRVGKKYNGRLLDEMEWGEIPEIQK